MYIETIANSVDRRSNKTRYVEVEINIQLWYNSTMINQGYCEHL